MELTKYSLIYKDGSLRFTAEEFKAHVCFNKFRERLLSASELQEFETCLHNNIHGEREVLAKQDKPNYFSYEDGTRKTVVYIPTETADEGTAYKLLHEKLRKTMTQRSIEWSQKIMQLKEEVTYLNQGLIHLHHDKRPALEEIK